MKLTCNTYDLKAACAKAARVIDKSPSPATNGLLLKAESGVLAVTGYNLTIGISVKIPAMIEIPGAIIADAKILTNAAGKLQKETRRFAPMMIFSPSRTDARISRSKAYMRSNTPSFQLPKMAQLAELTERISSS